MKKILLLIILFKSLTFAVDEKYEQLAQQSNTCAAYYAITTICLNNTKGSEKLVSQSYTLYESFLDTIVIDKKDNNLKDDLEKIVSEVIVTNTIMKNLDDKKKLAKIILNDIS